MGISVKQLMIITDMPADKVRSLPVIKFLCGRV